MEVDQSFCNLSLNIAEKAAIKVSLIEIKLNENFHSTKFWGKIFGIQRDYLLIQATKISHKIENKYFFSVDNGLSFSQLPIVEPWMNSKCMNIASTFTGNISHIYPDKKIKKSEESTEDEEEEKADSETDSKEETIDAEADVNGDEPPVAISKLTELDRISWTISKINHECFLVCKNSMRLTSTKIIEHNPHFKGLDRNSGNNLQSYLHMRMPVHPHSISKYRSSTAMNDTSFLDPIVDDLPHGCWQLRSLKSGLQIKIRNLLWPGFEFLYSVNHYCNGSQPLLLPTQAYFGSGIRRNDLVFMI